MSDNNATTNPTMLEQESDQQSAEAMPEQRRDRQSTEKFLALAHARWKLASEAESQSRREALDDLKFSIGEQWSDEIKQRREKSNRPCLTLNRLPQFIRQVTNNQRQQRPAIIVNPAGDGSSNDVAEVLRGMCRHIEVASDAEVAYDTAFEYMARTGKGFWRVLTQYCDETSFDQEIVIEAIPNPFSVYTDPAAKKADKSDALFKFIVDDLSHDEYKAQYPDSEMAGLADMSSVGDSQPEWATRESIRIAEYLYVELETSSLEKDGQRREVVKRRVKWAKINAVEILDERDWPGQWIPVIEVAGDDLIVDGSRYTAGMIRDAKDPQRMYNYWNSAATEAVALAPKAPFIGVKGQFTDPKWEYANTENYAYLEAEPVDINGQPAPPPQRNAIEPPIGAMTRMIMQADNDLKATIGIYDPSLGQRSADQSGRAIMALQNRGDLGTSNYADNLSRAIRFTGLILVDLIPKIYDAPRVQRIINPDQTVDHVGIFNSQSPAMQGMDPRMLQQAAAQQLPKVKKIYDIGAGKYDVTVTVGPSFQSKRQEAVASMLDLVKGNPSVFPMIGDLMVRNMDWHNASEIADRLKKMLPPQLQDGDDSDPEVRAQKMQGQLQQMGQQHQMLTDEVQKLSDMIKNKQVEQNTKLAIAKLDADVKIACAEITAKAQNQLARAKMEMDAYGMIHDSAHEVALQKDQQAHAANQAQAVQAAQAAQRAAQAAQGLQGQPQRGRPQQGRPQQNRSQ